MALPVGTGLNRYAYVVNNPMKYVHPTGTVMEQVCGTRMGPCADGTNMGFWDRDFGTQIARMEGQALASLVPTTFKHVGQGTLKAKAWTLR